MKKILLVLAMALFLACGVGVKGADATPYLWTAQDGEVDYRTPLFVTNTFASDQFVGLIDSSIDITTTVPGSTDYLTVFGYGITSSTVYFSNHIATNRKWAQA